LGGILGDATHKNIQLIYVASGALMILLVAIAASRPGFREFLAWDEPSPACV
jgi:hypothetical protein